AWDLGGQEGLRGIWDSYFKDADAILWVVDCSSPDRFQESKEVLEGVLAAPALQGVTFLAEGS
ncbi:ADP-ribosylation factor family-domain-containing protein, partial [Baffinella frigidus]